MDCPKCKCPNQPGATYCQMCYESLNRSAAESFIRNVRRERYDHQRQQNENSLNTLLGGVGRKLTEAFQEIDWPGIHEFLHLQTTRYKKMVVAAGIAFFVLVIFLILHTPSIRFRTLGHTLTYHFAAKDSRRYLTGFQADYKSWSEWNHQLDTPLEEFNLDEIGNIFIERVAASSSGTTIGVRPKEWIVIRRGQESSTSRAISLQDSSVAPFTIELDRRGFFPHRPTVLSPRLGRALDFILPVFPDRTLRLGNQWSESVQWVEVVGDWKIHWVGQLRWTLDNAGDCQEGTCAQLSFTGQIHPQIWAAPAWTSGVLGTPVFEVSPLQGTALFDIGHHRLISNNFTYEALFRIPIHDLGRIPWALRVGRRVRGVPGDLLVQLKDRIDIHGN